MTKLSRIAILRSGGTPTVDEPKFWSEDGVPWVAIGDMTRESRLTNTDRRVSELGMRMKNLPLGRPGTILFAMYASVGELAELNVLATWNQAILGIEPRSGKAVAHFIKYWLESQKLELMALTRSNTQSNLNAEQVGNLSFPNIPIEQQRAIADFLDAEIARIDALIEKKTRMAELLEERFMAYLDLALRDPRASTIGSLGRFVACKITDGPHETPIFSEEGIPFMSIEGIVDNRLNFLECRRISLELHDQYAKKCCPRYGDVLLAKTGATIGKVAIVETKRDFSIWSPLALLRPNPMALDSYYLWFTLRSSDLQRRIRLFATQSTQPNLSMPDIAQLRIALPSVTVQQEIVQRLRAMEDRIRALRADLIRQISLLSEHRQALITAAVTGQLDISGGAA